MTSKMIMMLGFVGSFVSSVASLMVLNKMYKDDEIKNHDVTPEYVKGLVSGKASQIQTIDLGENPLIPNEFLTKKLNRMAFRKMRGLDILYGPSGIGKSTYIREYLSEHIKNGGHGIVVNSSTSMDEIRTAFSIPKDGKLLDFLPTGTLVFVDQVENCKLDSESDRFFRMLAIESCQQNKFHAIACVSDPLQARRLLKLNGGDKIQYLCLSEDLKWTRSQVDLFISKIFPSLLDHELEEL